MAVTVPIDSPTASSVAPASAPHRESYIHFLARECRLILRWVVIFLAVTTAVTFGTLFYWAVLPGILLLIAYSMLLFANSLESSTRQPGDLGAEEVMSQAETTEELSAVATDEERRVINAAVWARLTKIGIAIALGVAALAVILAGVLFGGELLVLGTFIVFAYMLLVAAPLWLGWLEDEAEVVTHRVEHEMHPERA
jgi:hypothetical protein